MEMNVIISSLKNECAAIAEKEKNLKSALQEKKEKDEMARVLVENLTGKKVELKGEIYSRFFVIEEEEFNASNINIFVDNWIAKRKDIANNIASKLDQNFKTEFLINEDVITLAKLGKPILKVDLKNMEIITKATLTRELLKVQNIVLETLLEKL